MDALYLVLCLFEQCNISLVNDYYDWFFLMDLNLFLDWTESKFLGKIELNQFNEINNVDKILSD